MVGKCVDLKGGKHPRKLWLYSYTGVWRRGHSLLFRKSSLRLCGCTDLLMPSGSSVEFQLLVFRRKRETRQQSVSLLSNSVHPSSILCYFTTASRICGMLNPPTNQARRQQTLQTLAETKTLFPSPSVGGDSITWGCSPRLSCSVQTKWITE